MDPIVVGDNAISPNTGTYRLGDFPLADFGLRKTTTRPGFFDGASSPRPLPPGGSLRIIGSVSATNIPYRVTRLDDDTIDARKYYHISLVPLRDRHRNVLREMWIDQETFEPRKEIAERFVGSPTAFSYLVTVEQNHIAGVLVNTVLTGHFSAPLVGHAGEPGEIDPFPNERLADVAWTISDVSFPKMLPEWLFEPDNFKSHRSDPLPIALEPPAVPPPLPSIRHLVYNFSSASDLTESGVSLIAGTEAPMQLPTKQDQIIVDVVAATADRGLVVDITETSGGIESPVRVAIRLNGDLLYDSRISLTQQEIILLRLLGRNVIGAKDHQVGDAWTNAEDETNNQDAMSFRVLRVLPKQHETLEVTSAAAEATNHLNGSSMVQGTVEYDPTLSVPVSLSLAILNDSADESSPTKTQTTLSLILVEDSFDSKKRSK